MSCGHIFGREETWIYFSTSITQSKSIIRLRKLYIVDNILKYRSGNLIIFYYYMYSGLLGIIRVVIQNSIELIGNVESGTCINE